MGVFPTRSRAPEQCIQLPARGLHLDVREACPTQNDYHLPPKVYSPYVGKWPHC